MKKRILTLVVLLALMVSIMPAALAVPYMTHAGVEFIVEVEDHDQDDPRFWVGEEITLKSRRIDYLDHSDCGETTGVWVISFTDDICDGQIIAAAGSENTYTFTQDLEITFYYFYGEVATNSNGESVIFYSNPFQVTTLAKKQEDPSPEETPAPEEPEEEPYVFPFADVAESAWYYSDVFSANKLGLIDGKNSAQFCPDDTMTAAEAIKLAACLNQLYTDGEVTLENGTAAWYDTYVAYALEKGIIGGAYEDYNAAISRKEFVHIFYAAMPETEYAAKNEVADGSISDVAMDSEYADEIYTFYRAGILTGGTNGEFMGESTIKRSEVAAILTRMYDAEARK